METLGSQIESLDRKFDEAVDVGAEDMVKPPIFEVCTDGKGGVIGVGHDVVNSVGQGVDGAVGQVGTEMVDGLTSLAILLVVNDEGGTGCLEELLEGG